MKINSNGTITPKKDFFKTFPTLKGRSFRPIRVWPNAYGQALVRVRISGLIKPQTFSSMWFK